MEKVQATFRNKYDNGFGTFLPRYGIGEISKMRSFSLQKSVQGPNKGHLIIQYRARQSALDHIITERRSCRKRTALSVMESIPNALELARVKQHRADPIISKFGIDFTWHDLETLKPQKWLNDEVINFYLQFLMQRSKESNYLPKLHIFSSFFYLNLRNKGYEGVSRATRRISPSLLTDIDLIMFPIHLGQHWCLAAIDFRHRNILYYDSLHGNNQECLDLLYTWLASESEDKLGVPFNFDGWIQECRFNIPRQSNGYDCGVFVLVLADHLSRDASLNYSQSDMPLWRSMIAFEIASGKLLNHFKL